MGVKGKKKVWEVFGPKNWEEMFGELLAENSWYDGAVVEDDDVRLKITVEEVTRGR